MSRRPRLLDDVRHELARATWEAQRPAPRGASPGIRRRWKVGLAAGAMLLGVGVPAAAVTGVFESSTEPDGLVRTSEPRVILEGAAGEYGDWALLTSSSDRGPCLGLRVTGSEDPGETCGPKALGTLDLAVSRDPNRSTALAFGSAPDAAVQVRIAAEGDEARVVPALQDGAGVPGRFYVAQLPTDASRGAIRVTALNDGGEEVGRITLPGPTQ